MTNTDSDNSRELSELVLVIDIYNSFSINFKLLFVYIK